MNKAAEKIRFTKMHGIGNDYIYLDCMNGEPEEPSALAVAMSRRRFSVGADGLVLICPSDVADAKMRMFNADGSEGKMCGNAIRCVGKYLYDNRLTDKTTLEIETLAGIKRLWLNRGDDGKIKSVKVNMGSASFNPTDIPVLSENPLVMSSITVGGTELKVTAVSVGNPHAVYFTDAPEALDLEKIGPDFENHPLFPERVNSEFVRVTDETHLKMRVWERGSGETFACGTGACASVAAAVKNGFCPADTEITVSLVGGELKIICSSDMTLYMTGEAETAFEGVFEL